MLDGKIAAVITLLLLLVLTATRKEWYRSVIQGCRLLYGIQKKSFKAIRRLLPLLVAFFMEDASLWNMEIWSVNISRRIG